MVNNSGRRISAALPFGRFAQRQRPHRRNQRSPMTTYLLTCDCSAEIPVGPGQAGGQAVCRRCGQPVDVPRLGELTRLPVASPAENSAGSWSAAHGCLLGGGLVALLALAGACYLGTTPRPVFEVAAIRTAADRTPIGEIYAIWHGLSRSGIARPRTVEEERIEQRSRSARSVATVLWVVAAVGVAVAVGGGVALAGRRGPAA